MENKASVVKALRSLLRDSTRRAVPMERAYREHTGSLRIAKPSAERSSSWRRRQQRHTETLRMGHQQQGDEGSTSNSLHPGDTCSEPQLPSRATDLLSLEGNTLGKRARLCSLTSALEAQLQRLNFTEDLVQSTGSRPKEQHKQGYNHPHSVQTRSVGLQGGPVGGMLEEAQCVDLNSLLERDYSVQSMTSVVNEDCFYDTVIGIQKAAIPTL